ncbi:MAG: ATP-binding protein [Rhodocyclaceae bacterium]
MGRLFWRFLLFFWLAQITTMAGVGVAMWMRAQHGGLAGPDVEEAVSALQRGGVAELAKLNKTWEARGRRLPWVIDAQGRDVLGRTLPRPGGPRVAFDPRPGPQDKAAMPLGPTGNDNRPGDADSRADAWRDMPRGPRPQDWPDGPRMEDRPAMPGALGPGAFPGPASGLHSLTVRAGGAEYRVLPAWPPGPQMMGPHGPPRWQLPVEPLMIGAIVSLFFAGLLAWHYWRPISSLRNAFRDTARGALSVRLGTTLGKRRDEFGELGREFDIMADKLGMLMDGQRRLLHDVSHELRSPLARLQAAADVLRQRPHDAATMADRLDQELLRMDSMIDGLLTLSRLEAGVADTLDERVSLSELVAGVVEDARFETSSRARTITVSCEPDLVVRGSGELLHRAIENIVRNALLHTAGAVDVSLRRRPDAVRAELIVDDAGPGIPEHKREAVFDPFYRHAHADSHDGHGLGLAIARRTFLAHDGRIELLTRPGGPGLRVRVVLPLADEA